MAPPSPQDIHAYITELNKDTPDRAWAWNALVHQVRREFGSTTPAIESRIDKLLDDKSLVLLRVDSSGLVFWSDPAMESGWIDPYMPYTHSPLTWGTVTHERPKKPKNLWANGVRPFFVTADQYRSMVEEFTAEKKRRTEESRQRRADEKKAFRSALKDVAEDGFDLIRNLREALPESRLDVRLNDPLTGDPGGPRINLWLDPKDLDAFLGVLRAGVVLPKAVS